MLYRSWHTARFGLVLALVAIAAFLVPLMASAHESREVGDYQFIVGFLNEPAIVEEPNGLSLSVSRGTGENAEPVEGLAGSLQAEVTFGSETRSLELNPAFGQPGAYRAEFIPTAEGAYTFHIFGSIEGMEIDESFTSSPDTFSEVESRAAISFPETVPPVGEVAATAGDAEDTASTAQTIAIAGLAAGLIGLALGIAAIVMARRTQAPAPAGAAIHEPGD